MERLVTTSQAAEILGLSLQGVHYRIKKDQLKSIKKDGKTFVYIDTKLEKTSLTKNTYIPQDTISPIIEVKDEQIKLLKTSLKLMRKQYISEINRLEKSQKKVIEVFNSEIKLLQSAFSEMRSIYKPQLENTTANTTNNSFITLKDFFVKMKRYDKTQKEIKIIIFKAIQKNDYRFIYNKNEKKLLILDSDFKDLI